MSSASAPRPGSPRHDPHRERVLSNSNALLTSPLDRRASARDPESRALEDILERFAGVVRMIGARYRIAPEDGDELVQGLRTRLWRALGSSDRIAAVPAAYLYRAATSAALDIVRQRRAAETTVADEDAWAPLSLADPAPRPDELMERAELVALIDRAISTIAESRRPVVRMYLAGYGREEIAALLGWTEAKTRNLLYRGLADLRERLAAAGVRPELL